MPRVQLMKPKPPVKADPIGDLIRRYKKERRVSNEKLGEHLGLTRSGFDYRMAISPNGWTVDALRKVGRVLDIPASEIAEAVQDYLGK